MRRQGVSVDAFLRRDGRFLVLKRAERPATFFAGFWFLPGGKVEFGEAPLDALRREVEEETGLRVTNPRLLHAWAYLKSPTVHAVKLSYVAERWRGQLRLSSEHVEARWVTAEEYRRYLAEEAAEEVGDNELHRGVLRAVGEVLAVYIGRFGS